jgi:hypothetical protein
MGVVAKSYAGLSPFFEPLPVVPPADPPAVLLEHVVHGTKQGCVEAKALRSSTWHKEQSFISQQNESSHC